MSFQCISIYRKARGWGRSNCCAAAADDDSKEKYLVVVVVDFA